MQANTYTEEEITQIFRELIELAKTITTEDHHVEISKRLQYLFDASNHDHNILLPSIDGREILEAFKSIYFYPNTSAEDRHAIAGCIAKHLQPLNQGTGPVARMIALPAECIQLGVTPLPLKHQGLIHLFNHDVELTYFIKNDHDILYGDTGIAQREYSSCKWACSELEKLPDDQALTEEESEELAQLQHLSLKGFTRAQRVLMKFNFRERQYCATGSPIILAEAQHLAEPWAAFAIQLKQFEETLIATTSVGLPISTALAVVLQKPEFYHSDDVNRFLENIYQNKDARDYPQIGYVKRIIAEIVFGARNSLTGDLSLDDYHAVFSTLYSQADPDKHSPIDRVHALLEQAIIIDKNLSPEVQKQPLLERARVFNEMQASPVAKEPEVQASFARVFAAAGGEDKPVETGPAAQL